VTVIRILRFATLLLVALSMGMAFAHALELRPKMDYEPAMYLLPHRTLYEFFGPPVGGFIEAAAVLSSVALVFFVRRRGRAFLPTAAGAVCMVIAHVIWWLWVNPANVALVEMSLNSPPPDWTQFRNQWEYTHFARFFLQLVSLSALLISVLVETPETVGNSDLGARKVS
jgi:hypothetical protein